MEIFDIESFCGELAGFVHYWCSFIYLKLPDSSIFLATVIAVSAVASAFFQRSLSRTSSDTLKALGSQIDHLKILHIEEKQRNIAPFKDDILTIGSQLRSIMSRAKSIRIKLDNTKNGNDVFIVNTFRHSIQTGKVNDIWTAIFSLNSPGNISKEVVNLQGTSFDIRHFIVDVISTILDFDAHAHNTPFDSRGSEGCKYRNDYRQNLDIVDDSLQKAINHINGYLEDAGIKAFSHLSTIP